MVKLIPAIVVCLIALTGCNPKVIYEPVVVKVPVPVQAPTPPHFEKPLLPIDSLHTTDSPDVVVKAYVITIEILKEAVRARDLALDVYRQTIDRHNKDATK